jgi:hypothetical protein
MAFGFATVFAFFIPFKPLEAVSNIAIEGTAVVTFFALTLGAINQYAIHLPKIQEQKEGWAWSAFYLAELSIFIIIMVGIGSQSPLAIWITNYVRTPLRLGSSALYGPFVYRAILRSVHMKSRPVTLMIFIMVIVWMGYAPIFYSNIPGLYELGDWINSTLSSGPSHGYNLIISIVTVVTCVRVIIGREKGYLGSSE